MNAEEKVKIRISYEREDVNGIWENSFRDAKLEDILEGFYGLFVAQG